MDLLPNVEIIDTPGTTSFGFQSHTQRAYQAIEEAIRSIEDIISTCCQVINIPFNNHIGNLIHLTQRSFQEQTQQYHQSIHHIRRALEQQINKDLHVSGQFSDEIPLTKPLPPTISVEMSQDIKKTSKQIQISKKCL